jgi:hypothetical protein
VKPGYEPAPARVFPEARSARRNGGSRASARERVARAGQAGFTALVRGRTDPQLHRLFDRGPGLTVIFKGMERAFVPAKADGFEGEILYELRARDGARAWTLRVGDGRAAVRRGGATDPVLTFRTSVPNFVRMIAGDEFVPKLMLEGELVVEGDWALAGRMSEMFGGDST